MRPLQLKPTNDAVFKMMFTRGPDAHDALIGLLTAVLRPKSAIVAVVVQNPEISAEAVGNKRIVLDLKVTMADGTHCAVEMQTTREKTIPERLTHYGARLYSNQLASGTPYADVRPVIVIVFLAYLDDRFPRFHATYRISEDHDRTPLTDTLLVHVISLPRLANAPDAGGPDESLLVRWSRLLSAKTREEAASAAGDDPAMLKANATLDRLKDDPNARALAEARELATIWGRIEDAAQRKEGKDEGVVEGRAAAQVRAMLAVSKTVDAALPADAEAMVRAMEESTFDAFLAELVTTRAWPQRR